jgi:hypothetical protein
MSPSVINLQPGGSPWSVSQAFLHVVTSHQPLAAKKHLSIILGD